MRLTAMGYWRARFFQVILSKTPVSGRLVNCWNIDMASAVAASSTPLIGGAGMLLCACDNTVSMLCTKYIWG